MKIFVNILLLTVGNLVFFFSTARAEQSSVQPNLKNGVYQASAGLYCDFLIVKDETGLVKKMIPQNPAQYPQAYCYDTNPRLVRCDVHPSQKHLSYCAVKIEGNLKLGWMRILDDSGFAFVDDNLKDVLYYFRR